MNIHIESPGIKLKKSLVEKVNHLLHKLHKEDRATSSHVLLKIENDRQGINKLAEVKVHLPGKTLFSAARAPHFEVALKNAVGALKRQLE